MARNPIYEPKGRAAEYGDLALNIYTGCTHACTYCYAPLVLKKDKEAFHSAAQPRDGIVEAVERQLEKEDVKGRTIHLCFTCDPYPAPPADTIPTREIIKLLKRRWNHVQILTKGGDRARRDLDLLDCTDKFGVTVTSWDGKDEPGAASTQERIDSLNAAKELGIGTWMSLEPVLDPEFVYELLEMPKYKLNVDMFKIGKLNYRASDIAWKAFGERCVQICERMGHGYMLKADLVKEMEKGKPSV
jgi:DNA repair photolyase